MQKVNKWFENNIFLRFVAILLSLLIWFSVGDHTFPSILNDQEYLEIRDVKVETRFDQKRLILLDVNQKNVNLTLSGEKNSLEKVVPNYQVYVDLERLTPGKYQYATVQVDGLPEGLRYESNPKKLWVLVDRKVEKDFPVEIEWLGKYKEQLKYVSPEMKPSTVVVSGAQSHVSKVKKVQAQFEVDSWQSPYEQSVQLFAQGETERLQNVTLSKDYVNVQIPEGWKEKEVGLRPLVEVPPQSGIIVKEIIVKPDKLTLFGKKTQLDQIHEWVLPLDLSNVTEDQIIQQEVVLPEGVTSISKKTIELQIKVRKAG